MNCLSCRQDLPPTARFCSSCGTPCATDVTTGAAGSATAPVAAGRGRPSRTLPRRPTNASR